MRRNCSEPCPRSTYPSITSISNRSASFKQRPFAIVLLIVVSG
jgi:hypothetical protein